MIAVDTIAEWFGQAQKFWLQATPCSVNGDPRSNAQNIVEGGKRGYIAEGVAEPIALSMSIESK